MTPYVLASAGAVTFFLCRFSTELPVLVSIPPDASAREASALRTALRAWQEAGLGVRFKEVPRDRASIQIELLDEPPEREGRVGKGIRPAGPGAGTAVADCRVAAGALAPDAVSPLAAELERARVRLSRRKPPDWRGDVVEHTFEELLAAALHEFGHALGFQGHVRSGDSILSREPSRVLERAHRVAAGEPFAAPTLRALYAVPSGTVLRRESVSPWRTQLVDRMAAVAAREALLGPFVRVGDQVGRIFWRSERGAEYGFQIAHVAELLRDPAELAVFPEARARNVLPRSRDRWPE